jgi:hypothetical protein
LVDAKTMFQTPVAIFIFNRPQCTERLMEALAVVRPARLFVIADGPRNSVEMELCGRTRAIIDRIDWPCTVAKRYATANTGCRESIPNGLNWVFDQVDRCIILEDDCIPKPSFFPFCEELLYRYEDDPRVMTISGHRSDGPNESNGDSYFFSRYPSVWGWATWKGRWARFDLDMSRWGELRDSNWLDAILPTPRATAYWSRMFDHMKNGMDTWDYALAYSCWLNKGLSIRPKVNMIENIGFGKDATHTRDADSAEIHAKPMDVEFPLVHPTSLCVDEKADARIEWVSFSGMDERILQTIRCRIDRSRSHEDS